MIARLSLRSLRAFFGRALKQNASVSQQTGALVCVSE
jgi:hypothetical protein